METELKFHVPLPDLERMRHHPKFVQAGSDGPHEHQLLDTYYDTPQHDLWKHGLSLRVREDGGTWVQTVKTAAPSSPGLHQRGEWESALPDARPRPAALAAQIKQANLAQLLGTKDLAARLRPVFSNTTRRTAWTVKLPEGEEIACALDAGDIACGERHAKIAELELELKHGSPSHLFDFALALHQDIPMEMANDSKAARGYALLAPEPVQAVKARPVHLRPKMTLEAAFQAIALNCLEQMEANVPGVLKQDIESLHQMRVGLRRLRALADMFAALVPPPQDIAEGLDWLAGELGATRDWDVLADTTLAGIKGIDPRLLPDAARAKAGKHHKQMLQVIHSPRFTQLLLRLNGWFRGCQWRGNGALARNSPLAKAAGRAALPLLRTAEQRLARRARKLDEHDPLARHRVRIAAKKARYGAEFFHDVAPRQRVKHYIGALSMLQDRLGRMNDLALAERLLAELQNGNAELARQAAFARGYVSASLEAGSEGLGKAVKAVARLHMTH